MEITLEKIELVKDRTGVSYKEAKEALEKVDPGHERRGTRGGAHRHRPGSRGLRDLRGLSGDDRWRGRDPAFRLG